MINWANFLSQLVNGLALGALLALISSGLTIIYRTLGVLNLAHGAMFMLGGYAGWLTYSYTGSFYPPDVIKQYEKGEKFDSTVGQVYFRKEDHQLVRPVVIVKGKAPKDMKNKEDFWEVLEIVPGAPLMQAPDAFGCKLGDYT